MGFLFEHSTGFLPQSLDVVLTQSSLNAPHRSEFIKTGMTLGLHLLQLEIKCSVFFPKIKPGIIKSAHRILIEFNRRKFEAIETCEKHH